MYAFWQAHIQWQANGLGAVVDEDGADKRIKLLLASSYMAAVYRFV